MDRPRRPFKAVELGQYGIELGPATSDPVDEYPLARPSPLITDRNSLVTSGRCRGQDPETPAARLSRDWQECTARSDDVIQVIEDRCTLDEDLAAHEDQCRHAPDRAKLTKLRGLGKRRQRQQFEGYCESVQRDPDTSNVGRIVPADQYHPYIIPIALPRLTALAHGGHPGTHAAGGARRHAGRHNGDGSSRRAYAYTADELFPSVNYLTLPDRFLNDAGERADRLSIWEMPVYQEAILVAEGT